MAFCYAVLLVYAGVSYEIQKSSTYEETVKTKLIQ